MVEHEHSGVARRRDGAGGRRHDAPAESGTEARPDCREQLEVVLLERPVGAVTVRLDPAPAAETVAAGDSGDVADPGRTHHLVPARRAGEITASARAASAAACARADPPAPSSSFNGLPPAGRARRLGR